MYYIVEYEKGTAQRQVVTDGTGGERHFRFKRDAQAVSDELQLQTGQYIYKVWSSTQCPEGDCYICRDRRCPVRMDDQEGDSW